MEENVLYLPVSSVWFRMIKEGIKRVEYRNITERWIKRLFEVLVSSTEETIKVAAISNKLAKYYAGPNEENRTRLKWDIESGNLRPRYEYVEFTEGYPKKDDKERRARYKIVGIYIDYPQKGLCPDEFLNNEYLCIVFKGYRYLTTEETAGIKNCLSCKHCLPPAQRGKTMCKLFECKFEEA